MAYVSPCPERSQIAPEGEEPQRCYCGKAIEADMNYCSSECGEEHYQEEVAELLAGIGRKGR